MDSIKKDVAREIIDDFAKEIAACKRPGPKPQKAVIDFRTEQKNGFEREVYYVPIGLLRYRKDNGRISSDVIHYEKEHGILDEKSEQAQKIIRGFLEQKDREKTEVLMRTLEHEGQRDPAIVTCDGFLINGNRRKMALERLQDKHKGNSQFADMRVVILPGKGDPGGPPTQLEIEEIENRYQLQSEGKAEYYAFDRALSIRRKMENGMSLEHQLRDDPNYARLDEKKFKEAVTKAKAEYLKPLECIDRYLANLGKEGLYSIISTGMADREGRWQAFYDYYKSVYQKLEDNKQRMKLRIEEDEIGDIEDAAFKIIRMREIPDMPKVHMIIRNFSKWISNDKSKRELSKLVYIEPELLYEETIDENGNEFTPRVIDQRWAKKHKTKVTKHVKDARNLYERRKEKETPIDLLKNALKQLNHENMEPSNVEISNYAEAMKIAREIQDRANEIEHEFYGYQKQLKNLANKNN